MNCAAEKRQEQESMRIYLVHSSAINFRDELYKPLRTIEPASYQFIFPHADSDEPFPSRRLFEQRGCDLVLAEVSLPSIGLGIELGWASMMNVPIYAIARADAKVSNSIAAVSKELVRYQDAAALAAKVRRILASAFR